MTACPPTMQTSAGGTEPCGIFRSLKSFCRVSFCRGKSSMRSGRAYSEWNRMDFNMEKGHLSFEFGPDGQERRFRLETNSHGKAKLFENGSALHVEPRLLRLLAYL